MKYFCLNLIIFLVILNYYFGSVEIVSIEKQNKAPNLSADEIQNILTIDTTVESSSKILRVNLQSKVSEKKGKNLKSEQLEKITNDLKNEKINSKTSNNAEETSTLNPKTDFFVEPSEKPVISGILYNQSAEQYTAILNYKGNTYIVKESMKIDIFKIEKIEKDKILMSVNSHLITLKKN